MGGAALAMALIVALMFRECSLARRTGDVTRACGAVRPEACGGRRGICPARSRVGDIHVRPLGGACPGDRERGGTHQSLRDCGWATTLFGMKFLGSVRGTLGPPRADPQRAVPAVGWYSFSARTSGAGGSRGPVRACTHAGVALLLAPAGRARRRDRGPWAARPPARRAVPAGAPTAQSENALTRF